MAVHAFKYADYIKGGVNTVKGNLVPSVVAMLGAMIPIAGVCVIVNYMKGLKEAKTGKPIEIGNLFKFDNLVPNFIVALIQGITSSPCCCFVGWLLQFGLPIMADKPGTEPLNAVKASFNFGKQNLVGVIILMIAIGLVPMVVILPCVIVQFVLGMILQGGTINLILSLMITLVMLAALLVLIPVCIASIWNAYDDARAAIEASAAEAGVKLA
jgi:hypothetical protein